jgi:hypothetical protein
MPESLRLEDFSDREFLFALDDACDNDGQTATAAQVQAVLQLDHDHPHQCIGSRLGYLRTVGVVTYSEGEKGPRKWRLTHQGHEMLRASLTKAQSNALTAVRPEQAALAVRALGRTLLESDDLHATMMRREWRYGDARRRRSS